MGKNVILTGDLNVSRDLIDTAKAEDNMRSEGMTHTEYLSTPNRRVFNQLLWNGKVPGHRDEGREEPVLYDLCREFHPDREGMYTHWEQKINARPGNFGSRIDFVLCSIAIKDWFKDSNIQEGLMGSDHCPVYAVTYDKVSTCGMPRLAVESAQPGEEVHIIDLMNPLGMYRDGLRQRDYSPTKDVPSLSGKLLPEFTKRRNIRDMFSKKPSHVKAATATDGIIIDTPLATNSEVPVSTFAVTKTPDKEPTPLSEVFSVNGASAWNEHVSMPSPLNSPEKRSAPSMSPTKPVKRSKSSLSNMGSGTPSLAKGQQSLKGFFKSRTQTTDSDSAQVTNQSSSSQKVTNNTAESPATVSQTSDTSVPLPSSPAYIQTDPLASQEASKESWTKLFSKKPSPRCEGHAEPCIILTTKKPGVNCGRQFWMCSRPIGPSGQKETGTQWRCATFIWASDWKG
jgi:AP endonuclease-2